MLEKHTDSRTGRPTEVVVEDLNTDLASGLPLIYMIEVLSGQPIKSSSYSKDPSSRHHAICNVSTALDALSVRGVRVFGVAAEDIVDHNQKLILGLIWSLFHHFAVKSISHRPRSESASFTSGPDAGLLAWLQAQVADFDEVSITNYTTSWVDGTAWAALLAKLIPDRVDFHTITAPLRSGQGRDPRAVVLQSVFQAANDFADIPKLIDPVDMLQPKIDDKSVKMYCALFYHAAARLEETRALHAQTEELLAEKQALAAGLEAVQSESQVLEQSRSELETSLMESSFSHAEALSRASELENSLAEMEIKTATQTNLLSTMNEVRQALEDDLASTKRAVMGEQAARAALARSAEDDASRLEELTRRVEALASQMKAMGSVVATGAPIRSGWLEKHGAARRRRFSRGSPLAAEARPSVGWKRRWFTLTTDALVWYKTDSDVVARGRMELVGSDVRAVTSPSGHPLLEVSSRTHVLVVRASDEQSRDAWLMALQRKMTQLEYQEAAGRGEELDPRIASALNQDHVSEIVLQNLPVSLSAATTLGRFLNASFNTIHTFVIEDSALTDDGLAAIAPGLKLQTGLKVLRLRGNSLTQDSVPVLSDILRSLPILSVLSLGGNALGPDAGDWIGSAMKELPSLHTLDMANIDLQDDGLEAFFGMISSPQDATGIVDLNLSGNSLTVASVRSFEAWISDHRALCELDLSHNPLGDSGVTCLMDALRALQRDVTPDEPTTPKPGTAAAIMLERGLADKIHADDEPPTNIADKSILLLQVLSLAATGITNVGASSVSNYMADHDTLQKAVLSRNAIKATPDALSSADRAMGPLSIPASPVRSNRGVPADVIGGGPPVPPPYAYPQSSSEESIEPKSSSSSSEEFHEAVDPTSATSMTTSRPNSANRVRRERRSITSNIPLPVPGFVSQTPPRVHRSNSNPGFTMLLSDLVLTRELPARSVSTVASL